MKKKLTKLGERIKRAVRLVKRRLKNSAEHGSYVRNDHELFELLKPMGVQKGILRAGYGVEYLKGGSYVRVYDVAREYERVKAVAEAKSEKRRARWRMDARHKKLLKMMDRDGLPRYNHDKRRVHLSVHDTDPRMLGAARVTVGVGELTPAKIIEVHDAIGKAVEEVLKSGKK